MWARSSTNEGVKTTRVNLKRISIHGKNWFVVGGGKQADLCVEGDATVIFSPPALIKSVFSA